MFASYIMQGQIRTWQPQTPTKPHSAGGTEPRCLALQEKQLWPAGEMTTVAGDWSRWKTACVTGGDGYIGSALVKMLLEKGYAVKMTVRKSG